MAERQVTAEDLADMPEEVKALRRNERPASPEDAAAAGVAPEMAPEASRMSTIGHGLLQGFFKSGSDEAIGSITEAAQGPDVGWRGEDGIVRYLRTADDVYRAGRDSERATLEANRKAHPILDFMARAGGDIASDAVLNAFGVPVMSQGYQVASGAISGLMGSDAELTDDLRTPDDVKQAAGQTAFGGVLGYVAPKIGTALGKTVAPLLRKARSGFENLAVNTGRRVLQGGADLASATRKEVPPEAILQAIGDWGIVPFGTTQGAFKRLERLAEQRGDMYAGVLSELERLGVQGPDADAIAHQLYETALDKYAVTGANKEVSHEFAKQGQNLMDVSPEDTRRLGLQQAEEIKRDLQNRARWGLLNETPINEARKEIASTVRRANEDAIAEAGLQAGPGSEVKELADSFVPMKQQLGRTIATRDLAQKGTARILGRRAVGIQDQLYGMMTSGGDPASALAAAAGFSAARARVPSAIASGSYGLSRLAGMGAETAARNPATTQAVGQEIGAAAGRTAQPYLEQYLSRMRPADGAAQSTEGDMVRDLAMNNPEALGPYAQQLQQAAADGNLPIVHYSLQQKDPQYRRMLDQFRGGTQ